MIGRENKSISSAYSQSKEALENKERYNKKNRVKEIMFC